MKDEDDLIEIKDSLREVQLTEKLFQDIMANGPILRNQLNEHLNRYSTPSRKRQGYQRSLTSLAKDDFIKIPELSRNRSADYKIKRHMALECKLHYQPSNNKWDPYSQLTSAGIEGINVKQRELFLESPDQLQPKRGLSGSKLRKNSVSSKVCSTTQRYFDVSESNSESITPRSLSYSARTGSGLDTDEVSKKLRYLKWNSSDQGLRLQREISYVNSSRNVKRASEVVSYRVDPMYSMNGFKIDLQNRYCIQEREMKKLQEMTNLKESFNSNIKNLKNHNASNILSGKLTTNKQRIKAIKSSSKTKPVEKVGDTSLSQQPVTTNQIDDPAQTLDNEQYEQTDESKLE